MLLDEYTKEQFKGFIPEIDEATAENLYDYFSYRTPSPNFEHVLHQTAITYYGQYNRLLRDESVEYDAMVTDYIERLTKGKTTSSDNKETANNTTRENNGTSRQGGTNTTIQDSTDKRTETPNTKTVEDTSSSTNGSRKNTGTQGTETSSNDTRNENEYTGSRAMAKTNPMSITYGSFLNSPLLSGGGLPAQLDWSTSDSQSQDQAGRNTNTTNTGSENQTRTDDLTETTSDSGTGKRTTSNSGTNTTDQTGKTTTTENLGATNTTSGTDKTTGNITEKGSTTSEIRNTDRYTGRHGYSPAELLEKSRDYILLMKSFKWLCEKFNHCFVWNVEI